MTWQRPLTIAARTNERLPSSKDFFLYRSGRRETTSTQTFLNIDNAPARLTTREARKFSYKHYFPDSLLKLSARSWTAATVHYVANVATSLIMLHFKGEPVKSVIF